MKLACQSTSLYDVCVGVEETSINLYRKINILINYNDMFMYTVYRKKTIENKEHETVNFNLNISKYERKLDVTT